MEPRTESSSVLETRLAKTLLADLIEREADDYVSIEIVRESSDLAKTHRYRRKPADDVRTTKFVRETATGLRSEPVEERGTVQYVKYSAPYERIEVEPVLEVSGPIVEDAIEPPVIVHPAVEPHEPATAPFVQIDVWESGELVSSSHLVAIDEPDPSELLASSVAIDEPDPSELLATSNLVAIDARDPSDTLVDMAEIVPSPSPAPGGGRLRALLVVTILLGAFAIGLGVPFLL